MSIQLGIQWKLPSSSASIDAKYVSQSVTRIERVIKKKIFFGPFKLCTYVSIYYLLFTITTWKQSWKFLQLYFDSEKLNSIAKKIRKNIID